MKQVTMERTKKGWSQAKLAREADINSASMCRIEKGLEPHYPHRGQRIADALGWCGTVEDLFADVEEDGAPC